MSGPGGVPEENGKMRRITIVKRIKKAAVRWTAGLLGVLTALTVFVPGITVSAASDALLPASDRTGTDVTGKNLYVLSVSTGAASGSSVGYLAVRYRDLDGNRYTEYIFPHDKENRTSDDLIRKYHPSISGAERSASVREVVGYGAYTSDPNGFDIQSEFGCPDTLRPFTTDDFVFQTYREISSIDSINVFMHYDPERSDNKGEWTCVGMRVYILRTLYGWNMMGYYSPDRYLDFDGTLLAEMYTPQGGSTYEFSIGGSDKLFRVGLDDSPYYSLGAAWDEYNTSNKQMTVRMDFADVDGAGIETFSHVVGAEVNNMKRMPEAVALNVVYQDQTGFYRQARIPVISSAAGWIGKNAPDLLVGKTIGFAQQGDTLAFTGMFPGFEKLASCSLAFGGDVESSLDLRADYVAATQGNTDEYWDEFGRQLMKLTLGYEESISIAGISFYDPAETEIVYRREGAMIKCDVTGTPLFYFCAPTAGGVTVEQESAVRLSTDFRQVTDKNASGLRLLPDDGTEKYVVEITTDLTDVAGTTEDVSLRFNYEATDGKEKWTDPINLREATAAFYGRWPDHGGEIAYYKGMSAGGKIVFLLNNNDIAAFRSMEVTIGNTYGDDWQLRSIAIYRVTKRMPRKAEWAETNLTHGDDVTDCIFSREYPTSDRVLTYSKKVLVNSDMSTVNVEFDGTNGGRIEPRDVNWEEIQYGMSYNEALQDLGFVKTRVRYQVNVKVVSNAGADVDSGDCGSVNKFYFRLIFENGTSGYVQANQQLTADGFRAGEVESFVIAVNRDYGDVKSIHIIPDDSVDETNIYDKLNVEYIEVIRLSNSGVSRNWRVDNVGWIGIDFKDNGAQNTSDGQRARTEGEMSRAYQFNMSGTTFNFLFALKTGEYSKEGDQFVGTMTGTVEYRSTAGVIERANVDVVEAIAGYAQKSVPDSVNGGVDVTIGGKNRKISDPSFMFRENLTDRFIVTLSNVKELIGITLHVGAEQKDVVLNLDRLTVYQILEDGSLYINSNGEYQRDAQVEMICFSSSEDGYSVQTVYNAPTKTSVVQDLPILFGSNSISVDDNTMSAEIERVPTGDDDSLNLFVYLSEGTDVHGSFRLNAAIKYQMGNKDRDAQLSVADWIAGDGMLYVNGLSARGLADLRQISLKSDERLCVDCVVVQHVRSGVIVDTWFLDYYGENVSYGVPAKPGNSGRKESQTVTLQFSSDTVATGLIPDTKDIALAFTYTTLPDTGERIYTSPYVFLTDLGIDSIRPGQIVEIPFSQTYLRDVRQLQIVSIGSVDAVVTAASVRCVSSGTGTAGRNGTYSVLNRFPVTRTVTAVNVSAVPTVTFDVILTPPAAETLPAGGFSLELSAENGSGETRTFTFADTAPYLVSGGSAPGSAARYRILLPDAAALRSARLIPLGNDGKTWTGTVRYEWEANGTVSSRTAEGEDVGAEGLTVNLSDIGLKTTVRYLDAGGSVTYSRNDTEGKTVSVELKPGYSLWIGASVTGSAEGYRVKCESVGDGEGKFTLTEKDGGYSLTMPAADGNTEFRVTVSSAEDPAIRTEYRITFR